MKTFLVLYLAPASVLDAWMQKPESERQAEENAMKEGWNQWMQEHGSMLRQAARVGRPQKVTKGGIVSERNDVMMFSLVEGESEEAVAEIFARHPHLDIPEASIEVMLANTIPNTLV